MSVGGWVCFTYKRYTSEQLEKKDVITCNDTSLYSTLSNKEINDCSTEQMKQYRLREHSLLSYMKTN